MKLLSRLRRRLLPTIPSVDAATLVDPSLTLSLKFYTFSSGSLTPIERLVMNALVRRQRPRSVFEIGTFDGKTTLNIAMNVPDETAIYTLDLPSSEANRTALSIDDLDRRFINKPQSGREFAGAETGQRIEQLYGDSASFDFGRFYNKIDFIFVDGSHSYEYVKSDSETALRLRRSADSIILWHDYNRVGEWPGCTRALDELYSTRVEFRGLRYIAGTSFVILYEAPQ